MNEDMWKTLVYVLLAFLVIETTIFVCIALNEPVIVIEEINQECEPCFEDLTPVWKNIECDGFYCRFNNSIYIEGYGTCYKEGDDYYCPV